MTLKSYKIHKKFHLQTKQEFFHFNSYQAGFFLNISFDDSFGGNISVQKSLKYHTYRVFQLDMTYFEVPDDQQNLTSKF